MIIPEKFFAKLPEFLVFDCLPYISEQLLDKEEVVVAGQPHAQWLACPEEVMHVGSCVFSADITFAILIQLPIISLESAVLEVDRAFSGEELAMPGVSGGEDRIKGVNAQGDAFYYVNRIANSHNISWLVLRAVVRA